ncbi:MAG: DNA glycosylase [Armatimonadota bacterium]
MSDLLNYPREYLNLAYTLACGQAFRWQLDDDNWWSAPVRRKLIRIKEDDSGFLWETYPSDAGLELITDYFRLNDDVPAIYKHLSASDTHMSELICRFRGLRIVRQDPYETTLSYICSTANSVSRISSAIERFSRRYGRHITTIGGREHYSFPTVESLAEADPDELSAVGNLGWRGANIVDVARQILSRPPGWLESLRDASYGEAKSELMNIRGIGAKIADCICLFALDKDEAVPVDTHIRQVAVRYFMPELKTKTITPAAYNKIVQVFWNKFGNYAGWAQEFLYYEDLLRTRAVR